MKKQQFWPFQNMVNSRGHRTIDFPELHQDSPLPFHNFNVGDHDDDDNDNVVVLGKGLPENLKFEWVIHDWSKCSETCGGNGVQLRSINCIVRLHNSTQDVVNSLCEDAGLATPDTYRKCGSTDCPKWIVSKWSSCESSKCFRFNTGN